MRRNVGPDRALDTCNVEYAAVEDRIGDPVRSREVDVAGEGFPGLVHESAALIEKTMSVLIDDDPAGIDEHHRRRVRAARIDRLNMHAGPVARHKRAQFLRHVDTVASIEARSR